jgi:hypothetical protein
MRTPQDQQLHDTVVLNRAGQLAREGGRVLADAGDYPRPPVVNGYIPDVIANSRIMIISEIETADSYDSSHTQGQLMAFDAVTSYRLEVIVPESVYQRAVMLYARWGISVDLWRTFHG